MPLRGEKIGAGGAGVRQREHYCAINLSRGLQCRLIVGARGYFFAFSPFQRVGGGGRKNWHVGRHGGAENAMKNSLKPRSSGNCYEGLF